MFDEEGFEMQCICIVLVLDENIFLIGGQLEDVVWLNYYGLAWVSVLIVIEGLICGQVCMKIGEFIVGVFVILSGSVNGGIIMDNNGEFGFIYFEVGLFYMVMVSLDEVFFNGVFIFDFIFIN